LVLSRDKKGIKKLAEKRQIIEKPKDYHDATPLGRLAHSLKMFTEHFFYALPRNDE
jgi:hypothetical protein